MDCAELFADCNRLVNLQINAQWYSEEQYLCDVNVFENAPACLERLLLKGEFLKIIPSGSLAQFLRKQTKLHELSMDFDGIDIKDQTTLFKAIANLNLKSLSLFNLRLDRTIAAKARALFGRLESLRMDECFIDGLTRRRIGDGSIGYFSRCNKLHTLEINQMDNFLRAVTDADFGHLEKLTLILEDEDEDPASIIAFLNTLGSLNDLTIFEDPERKLCLFIADNMNKLQKFKILSRVSDSTDTCNSLVSTQNVRVLCLQNALSQVESFDKDDKEMCELRVAFVKTIASFVSLTCLEITEVVMHNDLIAAIGRIKSLKELKLIDGNDSDDVEVETEPLENLEKLEVMYIKGVPCMEISKPNLIRLITALVKLKSLKLILNNFKVGDKTYLTMEKIVNERGQILTFNTNDERTDPPELTSVYIERIPH